MLDDCLSPDAPAWHRQRSIFVTHLPRPRRKKPGIVGVVHDHVYRISTREEWARAAGEAHLPHNALDERDGFIHLSTAAQLEATLRRYFAGREGLVLLTIDADRLVDGSLHFESPHHADAHRRTEHFPHFYGEVPRAAILAADPLELDEAGEHRLPAAVRAAAEDERERERMGFDKLQVRLSWDDARGLAELEYPRPVRIEDEAGMLAWEAALEARIAAVTEGRGRVPLVVGVDNLSVAPKFERRYAELVDKLIARAFSVVVRWSRDPRQREFFNRVNHDHALPSEVFASREQAVEAALAEAPRPARASGG